MRFRGIWQTVFYGSLCNTGILKTRGIFRTLSNIYYGEFYSERCVTLAYLKSWHIQNPRHFYNTVKHLLWNILFKTLCNPDLFRALVYSHLSYILKSKQIESPTKYRRWSILLKALRNWSIFSTIARTDIFKLFAYSEPDCVSYSLIF